MSIKSRFDSRLYCLGACGLLVRLALAWLPENYLFYLVSDDAYYYVSVAKNLFDRGSFSADGITTTNGFHPLWLFLITPAFSLYSLSPWICIHIVLTFSAFFDTAAAALIYITLKNLDKPKTAFWATAFYLFNPFALLLTMNGLETALNNFLLALLIYTSLKASSNWLETGWFYLGTLCGLTFLSRTDNIFVIVTLFVYLFWQTRKFPLILKTSMVLFLVTTPWLAYNLWASGSVVQSSGTAYPFHSRQVYLNEYGTYLSLQLAAFTAKTAFFSFAQNAWHYGNWILSIVAAGVVFYRLPRWPRAARPLLWAFVSALLFLFFHLLVRWSVRPWYFQEAFVLTLPAVALAFEKVNRFLLVFGVGLALAFTGWYVALWKYRVADRSKVMLKIIEKEIPAQDRVGVFNSGYVQYFTHRKVINLDGLANNEVLSYYRQKQGFRYLQKRRIAWLLDQPSYLIDRFAPYFGKAADSLLEFEYAITNITLPGNTVILVKVHLDSLPYPAQLRQPLGPIIHQRQKKGSENLWGKIPLFEWVK